MTSIDHLNIPISDGTNLHMLNDGSGPPLLLLPGWSQTASMFRHQLFGLSDRFNVFALDWRGHGESEKVNYGYRISRFAKDLHEVLNWIDMPGINVLGHSMGNAVIWCYLDIFGADLINKIIIAEQPPSLVSQPGWSEEEVSNAGCVFSCTELIETCDSLAENNSDQFRADMLRDMFSSAISEADLNFIINENLLLPRSAAASLLRNTSMEDWRDVIPRINVPTLICAGTESIVPLSSQRWIQAQIPGCNLELFKGSEGGSHFMFWEAASKFNQVVADFLDQPTE